MIWSMKSSDSGGEGGEEDSGGGGESTKAVKWRRHGRQVSTTSASTTLGCRWMVQTMFVFFLITGTAAVLSNSTFKGEQQSDINARIGQSAFLPCELEPNNVTTGFEMTTQCGTVHSVKWYRGASRIFLYSGGPRTTQPHREGYTDRYDRSYWSTEPNSTLGFLVMDNITALDEGVYKCEITYTKVHEGCNIVQFINLTTYTDPESISVGTYAEIGDVSAHNYIDPSSDFYDDKNSDPKFGIMKKLTSGAIVGPVDEGNKIRLVCRAGRARPIPQVTWWQHSRGPIYDTDLVDYQYRKVDSDMSDDVFSYSGLWVAQSILTVIGKRGANGRYECRVKTATDSSPILTSNVEVTVNVSPYSVEMSTSSSGAPVTKVSKVDDRYKPQNSEHDRNSGAVVYAETTEGQPLVIRCAARGARPQANVTWYYYYKDQENDDDNDYGSGIKNEQNVRAPPVQSSKHGAPVMLGNSQQNGGSTARSPSDYLISEQRRMEGGAEIIGPVEIAQHTEYQADGTRDTHSQLSMSQLHRQQDGSILRCDAFNNVGSSPNQPLTVNMTIRVKYIPTAWVVPITDGENSGAIVEDEIKNEIGQQRKGGVDGSNNANPIVTDASKDTYDGLHYQSILYTVVVNETKELRLNCAYHANPDKLRTPVKWYRDGIELQLIDEEEPSSSNHGSSASSYAAVTPATGTGTLSGSSSGANTRFNTNTNPMGNSAKYARVKGLANGNGGIHGDGNGEDATVLVVRRLTRYDSGRYECRVRNSVGAANSTNFANVRVQYTPKVKLHVILDDSLDENQTSTTASSNINNNMVGSNPVVLESEHRNVTLRCAVQLEQDQQNIEDTNSDPSLNLTSVHWYWNGVQMQLPNCTRSPDSSDIFVDEDDGDNEFDTENNENENNAMNFNYDTSEPQREGEYDTYAVDNDTRRRNKKQRKVVCTDRELILVNVTKNIHGNYSCRAKNAAGLLTPMSDQTPLIVYFAPGPVTLEFSPRRVIKGRNVTLRCNAQFLGRPQHPTRYSWFRDGHPFYHQNQGLINPNINSGTGINLGTNGNTGGGNFNPDWFVDHVSLETRANFTCSAYNEGGVTYSEPVYIEVFAPPNYITGPPQYLGVAYNATHVNASCTVECYPHCSVNWLRRGVLIDPMNNPNDKERYSILTEYLPAERLKNDFEAVRSTLIWRMDNWPGGRGLDPITDSTEYSCRSSGNEVGPPVSESIMNFSVEYPPGNMTVSKTVVHVSEGNIPEKVFCHAEGRPQPTFEWRYIASTNNWNVPGNSSQSTQLSSQQRLLSIANAGNSGVGGGSGSGGSQINNQQLVLNSAVGRQQAGYYACVARNTHGNGTAYTYLDVMYKPSCQLRMITVDQFKQESSASLTDQSSELEEFLSSSSGEKRILVCTATANPGQVQYTWTIRNSGRQNDTTTSLTSDSPATERIITVSIGSSGNSGSNEVDNIGSYNRSILILQDRLEVTNNEDDDEGRGSDNIPNNGASEGVRTYVCTVYNTVGSDQCSIQVQAVRESDAPWWKQLLATIGLGGLPVMVVLVALVVILLLIVIIVIVILLLFVCKNRYIKPGNGVSGGRQKYSRGGAGQQQDNESNLGATGDSKAAFYENLPFHGMRPPPNQSPARQPRVSNGNGNTVGRTNCKPPLPLPPAETSTPSPPLSSLIHRSPNGGYVSLLRQATAPKSGDLVSRPAAAVRFNSLQRPKSGAATAWQRRDRQFRSMRTVGTGSSDKQLTELPTGRPTDGGDRQDNNNNNDDDDNGGVGDDKTKAPAAADRKDGRKDAFSASTFPKPAPRTRVPSASVAPPSLARRDTYENLQQLLNGDGSLVNSNKLTGVGIGARSLDEFYRMQIQQQHQLLYHRVTADDAAEAALTAGYSTVGGGVVHHRQQQQQQSIEMTQFEVTGSSREDTYQKSLKHQQKNAIGRYNDDNDNDRDDGVGSDADKIKSMNAGGTIGRRRRGSQQVLDGVGGGPLSDHYYSGGIGGSSQHLQQYHHHHQQQQQHGNRRRSNATSIGADGPPVQSVTTNNYNTVAANSSYNTVSGVGYYAADVYASMGTRQQQSKRQSQQQQQRPYCGVGTASAGNVSDEQSLTAKRSWRRQQNRRRRAGVGGGVVAVEPDDDAEQPQPVDASDYAADAEADDPPSPTPPQPLVDRYRNITATNELDHHHRPRQKNDVRNNPPGGGPTAAATPAAAAQQQANGGGANKNMVKFHDVGREIDV
ncbi:uncharacterized protein LOC100161772 isoform X4 [Acyrthosiphon pisum]|uniref:Ig-like domain-containing protein n=1 Tax=Acyrthosiphon pisum TaxID=7029 RepID=A0A8R1X1M3_ACYPI|nr:uncharacterized protein LOC100161772 isoform X4 [Acyrthosiphon pisum]|eukprot:XP_008180293.1 PREDICTED: uncharacterized protein LOC100161772 isoform X4 [Acyrthosiphon pisum]